MSPRTRSRLRDASAFFAFLGCTTLAVCLLVPPAVGQRLDQLRAAAKPEIEALGEREAVEGHLTPSPTPTPQETKIQASGKVSKKPRVIRDARVTAYHATVAETDSTPCQGAMPNIDFCHPPFRIVATNCLPLGTVVSILETRYTVADRMSPRYACDGSTGPIRFDVLNGIGLPTHADVHVL
jgi:hypothetical protein